MKVTLTNACTFEEKEYGPGEIEVEDPALAVYLTGAETAHQRQTAAAARKAEKATAPVAPAAPSAPPGPAKNSKKSETV